MKAKVHLETSICLSDGLESFQHFIDDEIGGLIGLQLPIFTHVHLCAPWHVEQHFAGRKSTSLCAGEAFVR